MHYHIAEILYLEHSSGERKKKIERKRKSDFLYLLGREETASQPISYVSLGNILIIELFIIYMISFS